LLTRLYSRIFFFLSDESGEFLDIQRHIIEINGIQLFILISWFTDLFDVFMPDEPNAFLYAQRKFMEIAMNLIDSLLTLCAPSDGISSSGF
jgi:hypothetical protein